MDVCADGVAVAVEPDGEAGAEQGFEQVADSEGLFDRIPSLVVLPVNHRQAPLLLASTFVSASAKPATIYLNLAPWKRQEPASIIQDEIDKETHSRESNATSPTSNLQFMEHRIEELEELVKILEDERDMSELITSDSWVSIGAVAKKLSRGRQAKGAKTASTTRDTGVGPSSKSATPVIQPPEEEVVGQPEVEASEQPAHTSPKKRAGKEKAKQPSSEDEDVGSPVATDRREPSVEKNVDEQPAKKSRPARGKAAKKTAKAAVRKNNDEDTHQEVEEEESNEHAAVVAKPRGAKKPVVAVPRARRKPTTKARVAEPPGEKDPADESDLIPPSNCLPIRPTVCAAKKRTAYKKDSVAIQLPFDRPFPPPESAQPIKKILYLISFMFTSRPSGAP
ncbi:hypothetical protein PtB15_2B598 [Puccinia triticina]|nr:hypothetical protein PtB15_2B598 [Puccinia triticina]